MEIRSEVRRFAERMEKQLAANDHKGHWADCDSEWLLARARDELAELEQAILDCDSEAIRNEAADAANFCMMICDNVP